MTTRGFTGRRQPPEIKDRIPPGQTLTDDFPVLSAGPTPRVRTEDWSFTLKDGPKPLIKWNWAEFNALPQTKFTRDIHCVTAWSKLDTPWQGVLIDDIFAEAGIEPPTEFALAHSFDGYATNVPVKDLVRRQGDDRHVLQWPAADGRSWRPGAVARSASLLLEVGEVDQRPAIHHA